MMVFVLVVPIGNNSSQVLQNGRECCSNHYRITAGDLRVMPMTWIFGGNFGGIFQGIGAVKCGLEQPSDVSLVSCHCLVSSQCLSLIDDALDANSYYSCGCHSYICHLCECVCLVNIFLFNMLCLYFSSALSKPLSCVPCDSSWDNCILSITHRD